MWWNSRSVSLFLLLTIIITSCSAPGPGARAWIDAPLDQSRHPLEILEIIAHASAAGGVSSFEFFVDGESLGRIQSGGGRLEAYTFAWEPPGPGVYEIGVQAVDGQGVTGSRTSATIVIGDVLLYGDRGTEAGFGECEGVDRFYTVIDPPLIQPGTCALLYWEVDAPQDWPLTVNGDPAGHVGEVTICPEQPAFIPFRLTTPMGTCRNWAHIAVRGDDASGPQSSQAPEIIFYADPLSISPGECSMLNWEVFPAGDYPLDINGTAAPFAGEFETCPEETRTYLLTAHHPDGPFQSSVTVEVASGPAPGGATPTPRPDPTPDSLPPVISSPAVSPADIYTSSCESCTPTTFHFSVVVSDNLSQGADIDVVLNWTGHDVRFGPESMHWTGIGDNYFNDLGFFVNAGYMDGFSVTATDAAGNSATYAIGGWHLVVYHCECY